MLKGCATLVTQSLVAARVRSCLCCQEQCPRRTTRTHTIYNLRRCRPFGSERAASGVYSHVLGARASVVCGQCTCAGSRRLLQYNPRAMGITDPRFPLESIHVRCPRVIHHRCVCSLSIPPSSPLGTSLPLPHAAVLWTPCISTRAWPLLTSHTKMRHNDRGNNGQATICRAV
jgi:hypothetical protein